MFNLKTHSTYFLFTLYVVGYMVIDHSDSERGNLLQPQRLLFPINGKGSFYMHYTTHTIAHTTVFVTPVAEHKLERDLAQWSTMRDRSDHSSHHERTLHHGATSRSLLLPSGINVQHALSV